MRTFIFTVLVLLAGLAQATVLTIDSDSTTIDGQTFDYASIIQGRKYITIRNCTFNNTVPVSGANPEGGLFFSGCRYITVENCVIDGQFRSCRGIRLDGCSRVTVRNCTIRNMNDDAMRIESCSYITIEDNELSSLYGCGTDGNFKTGCTCNNGHADGIQVLSVVHMDVHRNLIYGVSGTSGLMFGGSTATPVRFVNATNNLIHTPKAAAALYLRMGMMDCNLYNNTIRTGRYMSVWFEKNGPMTNLTLVNNVFGKFTWEIPFDSTQHHIHYNVISANVPTSTYPLPADNLINTDPQLTGPLGGSDTTGITPENFMPVSGSPCINAGTAADDAPSTDYFGYGRNGKIDIGGLEYNGVPAGITRHMPAETDGASYVTVYPNPMTDRLMISVSSEELADADCIVFDRSGHRVADLGMARTWIGKDESGRVVTPGVYYLQLVTEAGKSMVLPVMKQK